MNVRVVKKIFNVKNRNRPELVLIKYYKYLSCLHFKPNLTYKISFLPRRNDNELSITR